MRMDPGKAASTMPRLRFKPDAGSHGNRVRTTSQNSVEIQVTNGDFSIQTSTMVTSPRVFHQPMVSPNNLVLPSARLLQLMKTAGAKGQDSAYGEMFTFRQLCFYVKEYIKVRQLYDPVNPLVVHCAGDPLGQVFGVKQFTFHETLALVEKNILVLDSVCARQWSNQRHSSVCAGQRSNQRHRANTVDSSLTSKHDLLLPVRDCVTPVSGVDQVTSTTFNLTAPPAPHKYSMQSECLTDDESTACKYDTSSATKHLFLEANDKNTQPVSKSDIVREQKHEQNSSEEGREASNERCISTPRHHITVGTSQSCLEVEGHDHCTSCRENCPLIAESSTNWQHQSQSELPMSSQKPSTVNPSPMPSQQPSTVNPSPMPSQQPSTVNPSESSTDQVEPETSKPKRRRKRRRSDRYSESRYSLSIQYESDGDEGGPSQPWCLQLDLADSDQETVYSVQSKETVYVKDSSDDMWFLDEEDEISFEIESTQSGHYREEYEVESDTNSNYDNEDGYHSNGSESPVEDMIVNCDESDVEFWADREFSDEELDSTDDEIPVMDKWSCDSCSQLNRPTMRRCSKCWKLRSDWLPDHQQTPKKSSISNHSNKSAVPNSCDSNLLIGHNMNYSKNIVMDRFLNSQPDVITPLSEAQRNGNQTLKQYHTLKNVMKTPVSQPSPQKQDSSVSAISQTDTIILTESIKLPAQTNLHNDDSYCVAKGRLLPKLRLPTEDSGISSFTSSQESCHSVSWNSSHEVFPLSPMRKLKPLFSPAKERLTSSPRKRPISPYKRPQSCPMSPFSNKHNIFAFDSLGSPAKRLYQPPASTSLLTSANVSASPSPRKDASRRIFFVEPLPSPKRRAPNGVEYSDVCMICLSKPKEASIIHGKTGHQVCCYSCAKQLRRRGKPCPVCRRPIQRVIKNYLV